jgi:hypothetical protein
MRFVDMVEVSLLNGIVKVGRTGPVTSFRLEKLLWQGLGALLYDVTVTNSAKLKVSSKTIY